MQKHIIFTFWVISSVVATVMIYDLVFHKCVDVVGSVAWSDKFNEAAHFRRSYK